jgi:hypothetical protein
MGSGEKFRIDWLHPNVVSIGFGVIRNGEHEWSINIDLIKVGIYIGIGKGYDER